MKKNEKPIISNMKNLTYFKMPYILTILFLIILNKIKFYENFILFEEVIENILMGMTFAYIGLLGFLLSALTFILGLINKDTYMQLSTIVKYPESKLIQKEFNLTDEEMREPIKSLVNDFIFISFSITILVTLCLANIFLIKSNLYLIDKVLFYTFATIIIFLFFYIITCLINLLQQSYSIFNLFIKLNLLLELRIPIKKEINNKADELKGILISKKCDFDKEDIIISLIKYIRESDIENKQLYYDEIILEYSMEEDIFNKILKDME